MDLSLVESVRVQMPEQPRSRALVRYHATVLDLWAVLLPARIVNEDLGDYLEDIHRRIAAGQRWCVYLRIVAAIFWTGLNAIGYAMKLVGRRRAR
jgi:hypothetical protein